MPTPTKGPRLGGSPAHERLLLANLAAALFEHGRITTTVAKAKRLRPLAERLITFAKRGDLHARRQVLTVVRDKTVLHTLFAEIGPQFAARPGGYTRITRVGRRKGDNAAMAVIELVEAETVAQQAVGEAERARGTRFRRDQRPAAPVAAPAATTAAGVATATDAGPTDAGPTDTVPTEGDTDGTPEERSPQTAVPGEGGDTEVVTERPVEPTDNAAGENPAGDIVADLTGGRFSRTASAGEEVDDGTEPDSTSAGRGEGDSGAGGQAESAGETEQAEGDDERR